MRSAVATDPRPVRSPSSGRSIRVALLRGAIAFAVMAVLGQIAGLAVAAVSPIGLGSFPALGAFEFALANAVPLVARARLSLGGSTGGAFGAVFSGRLELGAALLLGTWLAAWLLYRGGRAAGDALGGGGPLARVAAGAMVAPTYAMGSLVLALVAVLRVRAPSALVSGAIDVRIAIVPALLLPLALGLVAGGLGGARSAVAAGSEDRPLRRTEAVLAGGWRMLVLGLAFSYAGLFIAGVVEPGSPAAWLTPTTGPYLRAVARHPGIGTVVLAHQLAAAPNEGIWALVPAMGGCDTLAGTPGGARPFACYGRIPVGIATPDLVALLTGPASLGLRFVSAPWPVYLFLLAPGAAAVLAGGWTARRVGTRSVRDAAALGAGAGIVFAVLVAVVGWLASLRVALEVSPSVIGRGGYRIGPELLVGTALALGWGAIGGGVGGLAQARSAIATR